MYRGTDIVFDLAPGDEVWNYTCISTSDKEASEVVRVFKKRGPPGAPGCFTWLIPPPVPSTVLLLGLPEYQHPRVLLSFALSSA